MKKISKTKNSNLLVKVMVMLMAVMVIFSALAPMKASAHSAYFVAVTLNEADARYEPMILFDNDYWNQRHHSHRESKVGYFGEYKYTSVALPEMKNPTPTTVEQALKDTKDKKYVVGGSKNAHLIFSFPGYHGTKNVDATSKDMARAEWVSTTMVQSLNDAISFVAQKSGKKPNKYELMYLGTNLANYGYVSGTNSFKYNGMTVKVTGQHKLVDETKFTKAQKDALKRTPVNELKGKVAGVNSDGYAKITVSGGGVTEESRVFVSKVPKGYKYNQPLYSSLPRELQINDYNPNDSKAKQDKNYKDVHGFSEDVKALTWKHVVLQAHYSFSANGITYDKVGEILKPNKVEQLFTEMGEGFLLMLRTMLGLHSFTELMLNEGVRGGGGYFLGIMPTAWLDSASILHWTSMALSWLLLMFAFVKVLALRNLAAINIAKRVDMVDGIKNLIVVGFALMLFNPIFYALANFNWLLVDVMKNTSHVTSSFGTTAPGAGLLAKLLINFAYLIMEIYFNFIYISRGIIVAILYGVGPLFVVSIAFGGKYAQIFSNYVRELVGTIYMQTFHAILVAFFASVTIFGGVRLFEQLVVLFAFIPLTKFFREAIGVGGGLTDIAGAGAFGAVGDMAKMGTKSMRQSGGKFSSNLKSSKQSGSNAPMTQMKSSSNFTNGNGASGGGDMAKVDNTSSSTMANQAGQGGFMKQQMSKAGDTFKRGMTDPDSDRGVAGTMAGGALKAAGSFVGVGGAVGMSAVGAGGVAQNMAQVKPMKQRSSTSRSGNQKQNNRKQKAPQEVFDNAGYEGSDISNDQSAVNHKFRMQEADGSSGMYDDYGITGVEEKGENLVYEYDYDANSNSFNAGTHNSGQQALKMQDMHKVFNTPSGSLTVEQSARMKDYKNQGVVSVKEENGRMQVTAKKGTGGIQGASAENGMYKFRKRNGDNGSVNMLDAIEYADTQENDNQS